MKQIKLLFLTSLVLVFTACGGGSSSGSDTDPITDPGTDPTTTEWDSANWDDLTWQ